jgi:hypothetical protein
MLGKGGSGAARSITYLPGDKVAAAFVKGAPLVEDDGYKVHASHRSEAGKVEVHARDTDIIYVLEGSATLVTGGTVVDGKTIEPDEVRGAAIRGGDSREIKRRRNHRPQRRSALVPEGARASELLRGEGPVNREFK